MAEETKMIDVLLGPYRAKRLKVSAADAQAAINDHWATDADAALDVPGDDDHPHPPLTEEERTHALEAATAWAQKQWDAAQGVPPPEPPPPEGRKASSEKRDMKPDEETGRYSTRDADDRSTKKR